MKDEKAICTESTSELTGLQFFISNWVDAYGYTATFAVQGVLIMCIAVPGIIVMHKFGARLRQISGAPSWVNPEHAIL